MKGLSVALAIGLLACKAPDNRLSGVGFYTIAERSMEVHGNVHGRNKLQSDTGCCVVTMPGVAGVGGLTVWSSAPLWPDTFAVVAPGLLISKGAWLRLERDGKVYESDSGSVYASNGFDVKMIGARVRMVTSGGSDTLHIKVSLALGVK